MSHQPTDHAGLETLPFDVCLRLLASVPIGRVGFYADGELVVLPVNHAMDGQDVVFRTASGSKLTAAEQQDLVAFEADDYDLQTLAGWSILVTGRARVVYDEIEASQLNRLNLHPWATTVEHPFWVRIHPTSVTGRRTPGIAGPEPGDPPGVP
ncbi:MAG TPA: pyridoxamine 5'-phosphate oxidase family protein [Streptosporangiaceae bacterium]|nr:pyridoxamine 5'-phosphate oxidase family protein [Streptosporangiaceae bacterium]